MNHLGSAGTVLLVDGDAVSAVTAATELHINGFRTIRAKSGPSALDVLLCEIRVDVVLIRAEAGDTSSVLRTAGEIRRCRELPIVFYAQRSSDSPGGSSEQRQPDVRIALGERAPELLAAVKSAMRSTHPVMCATPLRVDRAHVEQRVNDSRRLLERSLDLLRNASYAPPIRVASCQVV